MTHQQLQYAYWQRLRQQQLYRAYAAGYGNNKQEPVSTKATIALKAFDDETFSEILNPILDNITISVQNGSIKSYEYSDFPIEIDKNLVVQLSVYPDGYNQQPGKHYCKAIDLDNSEEHVSESYISFITNSDHSLSIYCRKMPDNNENTNIKTDESNELNYNDIDALL